MRIACFGSGSGSPGDPMYDAMCQVGRLLDQGGHEVLTGGFGGAGMEAPARGVWEESAGTRRAKGYVLGGNPANSYVDAVDCGSLGGPGVNFSIEQQFGLRLGCLLEADGFILLGGGPGTMLELLGFINLNFKLWEYTKRLAILSPPRRTALGMDEDMVVTIDWGKVLEEIHWKVIPSEVYETIRVVSTPTEAVKWVCSRPSSGEPATQRF